MSVLEEFYYGNIIPHEIPIDNGSDYAKVNKLIIRYDEILTSTPTENYSSNTKTTVLNC